MNLTKGKQTEPQRLFIYGPNGLGKSTLATMLPNPVLVDTERGSANLDVARVTTTKWADLTEVLQDASNGFKRLDEFLEKPVGTLVIDTADWACEALKQKVIKDHGEDSLEKVLGGFGKGFLILGDEWQKLVLDKLTRISLQYGVHIALVGHSDIKKTYDPGETASYDYFHPRLTKQVIARTQDWATSVWFINKPKNIVSNEDNKGIARKAAKTQVFTRAGATYFVKERRQQISDSFELDQADAILEKHFPLMRYETPKQSETAKQESKAAEFTVDQFIALVKGHEKAVTRFLISREAILEGEDFASIDKAFLARVGKNPDEFLKQAKNA